VAGRRDGPGQPSESVSRTSPNAGCRRRRFPFRPLVSRRPGSPSSAASRQVALPRGRPVLRAQRKPRSWPNRVSGTHSVEGTVAYGAGLARHLRRHKVEVIEVDRPNAGSPASPGRRLRRSGDNRSRDGEPAVTSRSQRLGTVRVGGRASELDAGAGPALRPLPVRLSDRPALVVFEIDGQRHMVRRRRGARLASDVIAAFDDPGRLGRSAYA